jgi:hypothetical protein
VPVAQGLAVTTTAPTTTIVDGIALLARHGGLVEVRIPKTTKGTVSGYFDDLEALVRAVQPWDGRATIFVTLNPVMPELLARAVNRLNAYAKDTTADRHIVRRCWFPVDFDPQRPSGISATDTEVAAALARRNETAAFLRELGFPAGVHAMSGNGGHAMWPVDLPNDAETARLFQCCLAALAARFGDAAIGIDLTVFNAARVWKLYGTLATKGDPTAERPHRRAVIETVPPTLNPVDPKVLLTLGAMAPIASTKMYSYANGASRTSMDIIGAFQQRGMYLRELHEGRHAVRCPWHEEHSSESGLTETVLFAPQSDGKPWGFDCKHAHCATRTIKDVLAFLRPSNSHGAHVVLDPLEDTAAVAVPYHFTPAFDPDHFVSRFDAYAGQRTDAAREYHEAAALVLLASATPGVRANLAPYPNGLPTNLYVALVGNSSQTRKSTAKNIAKDVQARTIPNGLMPELASPEGFIEELAQRSGDTATWYVDEMGEMLEKLHHAKHMAGLRGLLLTVYDGEDYRYKRKSKRAKGGVAVDDEDVIERPHLSVLAAMTPVVFDTLNEGDVSSGLLPRFAIVMPDTKPARRPFYMVPPDLEGLRMALAHELHGIYLWSRSKSRTVHFDAGALEAIDDFAESIESPAGVMSETVRTMFQRLTPTAVKVAMLVAVGRPGAVHRDHLLVTPADAAAALTIVDRWRQYAKTFGERIGENEFERHLQRCLKVVKAAGTVFRRIVARHAHVDKRTLDLIEATVVDRGLVRVVRLDSASGPDTTVWEWVG